MAQPRKARAQRFRDARIDMGLVSLAVDARRVHGRLRPEAEIDCVQEGMQNTGRDAIAARPAAGEDRMPSFAATSDGAAKIGILPGRMQFA